MMTIATGTIKHNDWIEKSYHEVGTQKATTVEANCVFDGTITADAPVRFLMQYTDEKTVHYSGYLLASGSIEGKSGTFVIYEVGTWENGIASSTWQIVSNSGTGGLTGLSGSGSYKAEHDKTVRYELEYRLG
jgi:hypothetical protein